MVMTTLIIAVTSMIKIHSVVHGQGVITTKDNAQFISLSKGGTIDKIFFAEGAMVKKGDLLAKVVNLDLQKEYERIKAQQDFLIKDIKELSSILNREEGLGRFVTSHDLSIINNREVSANIELVSSQIKTKDIRFRSLGSEVSGLERQLTGKKAEVALLTEEVEILTPLVKKGISPYTNFLNKKQSLIKLTSEMNDTENNINLKKNELDLVTNEIRALDNELRFSLSKQLSKNQQELDVINSPLKILQQQIEEENVRSPVNGVIYKINKSASTQGGVIQAADLLFEIKPMVNTMLAEVKINPKYRDQIYIGEQVKVDILSIIRAKGKSYEATIDKISPDSYEESSNGGMQRYYKVVIVFNVNDDDINWLKPGMTVDASVITGKHSIMQYLVSPLLKGVDKAFSEPVNPVRYG